MSDDFPVLEDVQQRASDPSGSAWLSASAGTGKTQVITARVLRLLLSGVEPSSILCLTFTKAGAAEMAHRIHARLAGWVRRKEGDLGRDLIALGEDPGPGRRALARTLFARVLDAPGGGLRIETIHAFAQSLLASFPVEAGVAPGFRPLDGRGEALLRHRVLSELLVSAEAGGDLGLIRDVQALSRRLGEEQAQILLAECARAPDAFAALGPREGIEPQLRRLFGVPADDVEAALVEACADERFDCARLRRLAAANRAWGTTTGAAHADALERWLEGDGAARAAALKELSEVTHTREGALRKIHKGQLAAEPAYAALAAGLGDACKALVQLRLRAATAALMATLWRAGQAFARAYAEAKRAAALVDFDDLIRSAERLLTAARMSEWVRYKLDRGIDHILVDEGQDTNLQQWRIIDALTSEFFAGAGASRQHRTIFSVGDFKQAIFGFQGTDPEAFSTASKRFSILAQLAEQEVAELTLDKSYRSTPPLLALVDRWLTDAGAEALGLDRAPPPHRSAKAGMGGSVTLWAPVVAGGAEDGEEDEEGWIDDAVRGFAAKLADQIRAWLDEPLWLPAKGRALRPEDILILVSRRGDLAALIVARLHQAGVAVAGVDRLRLASPLAVKDLLAALRFAIQPEDDLNLAALLTSPLLGWSQEALFDLAHGRGSASLWRRLRARGEENADVAALLALLAMADFATPHRFLETILSGPLDGRRRLFSRLGEEARDPIDELLNAALDFEREATPSLQRFLEWFDRDDVDVRRDPSAPLDAVRVMTVHGAKGLQAPLVILADAGFDPERRPQRALSLTLDEERQPVPIFTPRKDERLGPLEDVIAAAARKDRAEHWRLLYVALTRAEEMLVVGGALGPAAKGVPPPQSWYAAVDRALGALGAEWQEDARWGRVRRYAEPSVVAAFRRPVERAPAPVEQPEPSWLRAPAPAEERPPRPLAPSAIGADTVAQPPPTPALREAARRGSLLHALFERLPPVAPARRREVAERWLAGAGAVAEENARREIAGAALAVMEDSRFADLFAPGALAEAPIAAVVGGEVIAGTVDRLIVAPDRVRVIDFKTGRRVPASAEAAPAHHLAQMAAYAAALAVIFPGRRIEATLLYTAGPRLLTLPQALLDAHKPGLVRPEQSFASGS